MKPFCYLLYREFCPTRRRLRRYATLFFVAIITLGSTSCSFIGSTPSKTGNSSRPQHSSLKSSTSIPLGGSSQSTIKDWFLTFDEEFNGSDLNTAVWNSEDYGSGRYQNCCLFFGSQYFTSQSIYVQQGALRIISQKKSFDGKDYLSGAITTENKFSFLYGRVDISARLPKGQGMWPGLWALTANADHEIDLMEMVNNPTIVYQTFHLNDPTYNTSVSQCKITGQSLSNTFHVYSFVWNASSLNWYIDGLQTCKITQSIPQTPMYLLLDAAVGGSWPGSPDINTDFPQFTDVDYVRVYQASPEAPCSGLQVTSPLQLKSTNVAVGDTIYATATYTNKCTTPFSLLDLLIAARTSDGQNADFGNTKSITLQPGQSVTIHASRALETTDPIGPAYAFSSFETSDGNWHSDGTNLVNFTITN